MEIETRKVGKSNKYYLAHSFREGKKVKKIRRYLGTNLSEKQIENLRKRAEEIIKEQIKQYKIIQNPLNIELTENQIKLIKDIEKKVELKLTYLSEKDWKIFTELFTYNTNAIEGSEVKLNEVREILEENKWPKEVNKSDIAETYGVAEAIKLLRQTKEHISLSFIKKLKTFAGKFRSKGIEVIIRDNLGNIVHTGAPSNRIKGLLEELIDWYNKHKNKYSGLILAAVIHNQFEVIHPFEDGNGRVGRLLMNNILIKHNLAPVDIRLNNRRNYYSSIQAYQNKGDIK